MAVANELSAIPFGALIGGPMTAAVEAQAKSAMTSVEFIRTVGFDQAGNVINVVFKFKNGPADTDVMTLEVPLLTILPIPFLRIETMDINFKASISQSTQTSDSTRSVLETGANLKVGGGNLFVKAELNASISSKKDTSSTRDSRYAVEYTMDISVHAVQDDVPGGMAKVLNLLTESVDRKLQVRPASGGGGGG